MAIVEIAVKADVSEIENLIDQLKDLQTYKFYEGAEQTLVDIDEVVKIFTDHVEAKVAQPEIIRCKECIHYHEDIFGSEIGIGRPYDVLIVGHHGCDFWKGKDGVKDYHFVDREGFCSWAERKEDGLV